MEKKTGAFINSGALQANASEAFLDIGTSLVVLAGILLAHAKIPYHDRHMVLRSELSTHTAHRRGTGYFVSYSEGVAGDESSKRCVCGYHRLYIDRERAREEMIEKPSRPR